MRRATSFYSRVYVSDFYRFSGSGWVNGGKGPNSNSKIDYDIGFHIGFHSSFRFQNLFSGLGPYTHLPDPKLKIEKKSGTDPWCSIVN
jgi:hypothetical protein